MSKRKRITDITVAVILAVLILGLIALYMLPAGGRNIVPDSGSSKELTYEDYNGKKIGILTGTNLEADSFKYFPDSEYFYFDGYPNLNTALESGVIDAFPGSTPDSIVLYRKGTPYGVPFLYGADNRSPAASPFGSRSRPLAGLFHRPASAIGGSNVHWTFSLSPMPSQVRLLFLLYNKLRPLE